MLRCSSASDHGTRPTGPTPQMNGSAGHHATVSRRARSSGTSPDRYAGIGKCWTDERDRMAGIEVEACRSGRPWCLDGDDNDAQSNGGDDGTIG